MGETITEGPSYQNKIKALLVGLSIGSLDDAEKNAVLLNNGKLGLTLFIEGGENFLTLDQAVDIYSRGEPISLAQAEFYKPE